MSDSLPDYYAILEITPSATDIQIKTAYKKAALKWHPDRVPIDSSERPKRTKKFQAINDAYYTLSDTTRRREYDSARSFHTGSYTPFDDDDDADEEDIPRPKKSAPAGMGGLASMFFSWAFGGKGGEADAEETANNQFGRAFEEMMNDDLTDGEGEARKPNGRFWAIAGTLSGVVLGFIMANVPGATVGGAVGNRLGTMRDTHGQAVYKTFQQLPQGERSRLLTELATKLFAGALS